MGPKTLSILAIGTLAGCGAGDAPRTGQPKSADTSTSADSVPSVDDSLARLRALNVVRAEDLIVGLPGEAYNCYGQLCKDWQDEYEAAEPTVAPRLAAFVDAATSAAADAPACAGCMERVDDNLAQLRALSLFRSVDIILEQAKNDPNCYNTPCADDVAAANATNAERAAQLDAIALATRGR